MLAVALALRATARRDERAFVPVARDVLRLRRQQAAEDLDLAS
ncbi:MAG: hypothetical protein PGN07_02585 [Aeromicrobium erythreum]